jgi:molybdate transport system regulatory protein
MLERGAIVSVTVQMSKRSKSTDSVSLNIRLRIGGGKIALGPGKVALLEALVETGSIGEAAKRMEMSYMRAWSMVKTMKPFVTAARGGKGGGGARLTDAGKEVIRLYRQMEVSGREAVEADWERLRRLFGE